MKNPKVKLAFRVIFKFLKYKMHLFLVIINAINIFRCLSKIVVHYLNFMPLLKTEGIQRNYFSIVNALGILFLPFY